MLVLSRRTNERIVFPGLDVSVQVLSLCRGKVRLGVDAPPQVEVIRGELPNRTAEWGEEEISGAPSGTERLLRKKNTQLRHRLKGVSADLRLLRKQLQLGLWSDAEETVAKMQNDMRVIKN